MSWRGLVAWARGSSRTEEEEGLLVTRGSGMGMLDCRAGAVRAGRCRGRAPRMYKCNRRSLCPSSTACHHPVTECRRALPPPPP